MVVNSEVDIIAEHTAEYVDIMKHCKRSKPSIKQHMKGIVSQTSNTHNQDHFG